MPRSDTAREIQSRKAMWLGEWHYEQRTFDLINDSMAACYKAKLENRSYRNDASQEGKTPQAHIEDRLRKAR